MRRSIFLNLALIALLIGASGCGDRNRTAEKLATDTQGAQKFDSNLTFNNVTLEQANDKGQLWWRVKAKQAVYAKDQKNATVQEPKGELFQDGKPIFKLEAQRSEIQQDGKSIILKGQITAVDIRDGSVLKGNEMEWRPTEDVLIIRNGFNADHEQVQLAAKEGRFLTRARRVDVTGQIVAQAKDPTLQLRGERLTWLIQAQKLSSDRPIQVDRYENKQVTDRGGADQTEVDLKSKIVNLRQNARIALRSSNTQVSSNALSWNVDQKTLSASEPVMIVNSAQQVTLTADQGEMLLDQQIANLSGNVRGVGERNQSRLSADRVKWFLATQQFEANGNVNYQQSNPPFSIAGPQASGKLDTQQVAVNGGQQGGRVEIQITPQGLGR
ncbi:LPS export ABC transporter periplasmic protein LptC [Leptolyngbya sp. FACHB-17]|uniref:LPS export ABC transporter periplasmic protein LptC n=1 Tax=unclassified Leptolyngbya TaxID=2650499 RepID=UPI00168198DE|nr:LPS export ABC transporter periplasmic protein LptC [Leptolyngbya sp. FACHB-17]MBD2080906.1 LPS export ABC transporter periplasmic protein LptC [Leptolyngbya sp. FACHB-17]